VELGSCNQLETSKEEGRGAGGLWRPLPNLKEGDPSVLEEARRKKGGSAEAFVKKVNGKKGRGLTEEDHRGERSPRLLTNENYGWTVRTAKFPRPRQRRAERSGEATTGGKSPAKISDRSNRSKSAGA